MKPLSLLGLFVSILFAVPTLARAEAADPAVIYANTQAAGGITYREGWFGRGETKLHYVEAGKGPMVILYHGFPSTWFSWFDLMEELKHSHRVVAVDALGAGRSAKPEQLAPYRIDRLARQLDRLALHLDGRRKFILVGHDWGAALSLAYAQAYPKRLNAVVGMSAPPYNLFLDLVSSNHEQRRRSAYMDRFVKQTKVDVQTSGFAPRFAAQVYGGLRDAGHLSIEEAEIFQNAVGDLDAMYGGINWYRANLPPFESLDKVVRWPRHNRPIKVPVLMVWGESDQTFLPTFLDSMPAYAEKLSILRIQDVGHMTPIENSDKLVGKIADFVNGH